MAKAKGSDERLSELEARYMQLDNTVQQLSEVMYRQQRQLDALHELLDRVRQKFAGEPGLVDAARDEKPPHY